MTDGFSEFYCLYLHGAYYCQKSNETVLEVIDFMIDKTYFIHLGSGLNLDNIVFDHWKNY